VKIDTANIPVEGLHLKLKEKENSLKDLLGEKGSCLVSHSQICANLAITKEANGVFVKGDIATKVVKRCSRCLKKFNENLNLDVDLTFVSYEGDDIVESEHELSSSDVELSFLINAELDTTEIIREQIAVGLPIKYLCQKDCKGLCARCGGNQNLGECKCAKDIDVDPRFSKLKNLKINERR
jgi:uncharacterized protein